MEEKFLELVKPKVAIICVGKNNFGHPSSDVIKRINEKRQYLFRTDLNGAITITTNGNSFKIKKMIQ